MTGTPSWNSLVVRLGERCPEYGGHADAEEHIVHLLRELPNHGDQFLSLLMQSAEELPHKDPLYGTLVGLINLEDNEFGAKVVAKTHTRLQDALSLGNCNRIRILIRFLTVLMSSNVVTPGCLIDVFEMLVSSAATTVDEERGNLSWQPCADFYVSCILASLPWGGLELSERVPEELERVLLGVEAYFSLRKRVVQPGLAVFDSVGEGEQDYLEDLWQRIQALRDAGWKVESVPRPHLVFEARLATAQSHDFGALECPEIPQPPVVRTVVSMGRQYIEAAEKYPQRMRRLCIFPASKTDEKMTPIDRFVIEEYLLDVLFYLNGCRKECAAYMVGLPVPFRYEYLMAETVFSQLLLLPKPPFKLIYYTIVIVDLCKALPGAFPAVVAGAVRALFDRVGEMDVECRTRLTQWLSHHLSNFQFVWPWEEWEHVLDQPIWSPQRVFAEEVLEKEIRLSYWEKVKESVQTIPRLARLLPPKNNLSFKYSADKQGKASDAEIALATDLIGLVRGKKTAKDVQTWVEERIIPTHGAKVAIDIVVQTFLYVGSKSFTHLVTVLEKFGQVLHKLAPDLASQALIVEVVAAFWQNSHQMIALAVDRMMGYRIVSNLAIVNWAFSDYNVQRFHTSDHVWEVLRNAVSKTNSRTADLKKELITAEKAVQGAKVAVEEASVKHETAQRLVDTLEQDQGRAQAISKADWAKLVWNKKIEEANSLEEALEAKEALLARGIREQEALFVTIFQNFVLILTERLHISKPEVREAEVLDQGGTKTMDLDAVPPAEGEEEIDTEAKSDRPMINGQADGETEDLEEQQWRRCTLGWLRFIVRYYSNEVWMLIERLDSEIFTQGLHPLIAEAVNTGLRRHA